MKIPVYAGQYQFSHHILEILTSFCRPPWNCPLLAKSSMFKGRGFHTLPFSFTTDASQGNSTTLVMPTRPEGWRAIGSWSVWVAPSAQAQSMTAPKAPKDREKTAYPTRSRMILEQKTNRQESWTHSVVGAAPPASGTWGHGAHTSLRGLAGSHLGEGRAGRRD